MIGTAFADTLTGSASADQLRGGGGNDVVDGLAGDDRIVGGAGADILTGGADNDTFVFDSAPNAVDSITDFNASGSAASGDLIELSLPTFTCADDAERKHFGGRRVRFVERRWCGGHRRQRPCT